jgi:homoserine dehydrogenase
MMIPRSELLAAVHGATNAVLLVGKKGGNTMLTGQGAGGGPTGLAVLSDIVQIARAMMGGSPNSTPLGYATLHRTKIAPRGENITASYLRLVVRDRPGILARVAGILARHRINIDSVLQEPGHEKKHLPFVMTLEPTRQRLLARALSEIARLPFLAEPPLMLPFAELP